MRKKNGEMMRNFTVIDEEFVCENCGKKVSKLGYSCRNHCPYCLHSKHVDVNPGDRQEGCHWDLEPVGLEISNKKGYVIIFKCKKQKFDFLRFAQLHCFWRICQFFDWAFGNDFQSLQQHVVLFGSNFHGFFLGAWPTESANI